MNLNNIGKLGKQIGGKNLRCGDSRGVRNMRMVEAKIVCAKGMFVNFVK